MHVRIGMTDGTMTEIQSTQLPENSQVVIGEQQQASADAQTTNPFTPQLMRGH
jgi:hypothetical protein